MTELDSIENLIREHFERRPLMRVTDVYKLLYQCVFGIGHIMGNDAWSWLEAEAENVDLNTHPEEPFLEDISADGSMVRVNLRPYLRRGLPLEKLFSAMKKSALIEGKAEEFLNAWAIFKELVRTGKVSVDLEELDELDSELRREGCRPHHHSETYREAYHPAYRVVRRDVLNKKIHSTSNK